MLRECTQRLLETAEFIRNVGNNSTGVQNANTTNSTTVCLATARLVRVEGDNRDVDVDSHIRDKRTSCNLTADKHEITSRDRQWLRICLPRRPPTNVARVRFPDAASYVG